MNLNDIVNECMGYIEPQAEIWQEFHREFVENFEDIGLQIVSALNNKIMPQIFASGNINQTIRYSYNAVTCELIFEYKL